ncbi:MAG: hypothetical protein PHN93_09385, partial [Sphaerochaetaceae bacterium]|nr:hypothetical protein [Sphaerochaetaceae bacterium]
YCGYGRLHKAPLFLEGGPYGDCIASDQKVVTPLPKTEMTAHTTFLAAPRFETECDELIHQYITAYHKVSEHIEEVLAYMRSNDLSKELARLSGRSIAML